MITVPPPLRLGEHLLDFERPRVVGVLNITPDSFSDGGLYNEPAAAIARGREMKAEGADLIDVGGESTRPGAEPLTAEEELRRTLPVIRGLADVGIPLSIDTRRPEVAAAALEAGAAMINDIGGLGPEMLDVAREHRAPVIVMHMQGEPRTMQRSPRYDDVVAEVVSFLDQRLAAATAAGLRVVLDPGIGFGKTVEHNLTLLANLDRLIRLGAPVLIGLSRKSFLGKITGAPVADRLASTLAANTAAALAGAHLFRVHDVRPHREALDVVRRLRGARRAYSGLTLQISGIACRARIGATADERASPQELCLDLEAEVDPPSNDRLQQAVDYGQLAGEARAVAEKGERSLVETLVTDVAAALLGRFPLRRVVVRCHKPAAARELEAERVAVEVCADPQASPAGGHVTTR